MDQEARSAAAFRAAARDRGGDGADLLHRVWDGPITSTPGTIISSLTF